MQSFTHPLAWIRSERGWSQSDLARLLALAAARRGERTGIDGNRISKWERGITPLPESQALLADVLQVPAAALALGWPTWLPAHTDPLPFTPAGSRLTLMEAIVAHTDRRAFLLTGAAALADTAYHWATSDPGHLAPRASGRRVDPDLLTWLEERTHELRAFATTDGLLVADLLQAHLTTVVNLIDTGIYDTPTGRRLHICAAELASAFGWLLFDQGRHGAAQRTWSAALHAAHQADDRDLGAGCLADLAYLATWLHHPAHAVTILDHAATRTRSPAALSLLHVRRARALATLGDTAGCTRALSAADTALDRATPETTPTWVSWMSPADLQVDTGRCWLDLGRPARATRALDEGLTLLDPARSRTRAVFQVVQADSALRTHDLDRAVTHAHTALETALTTGASRCTDLVRTLIPRLAAHAHGTPHVAAFLDTAEQRLQTA